MYTQRQQVTGKGKNSKQRNTTAFYVELYHSHQVKKDSVLKVSIKVGHHLLSLPVFHSEEVKINIPRLSTGLVCLRRLVQEGVETMIVSSRCGPAELRSKCMMSSNCVLSCFMYSNQNKQQFSLTFLDDFPQLRKCNHIIFSSSAKLICCYMTFTALAFFKIVICIQG